MPGVVNCVTPVKGGREEYNDPSSRNSLGWAHRYDGLGKGEVGGDKKRYPPHAILKRKPSVVFNSLI